MILAFKSIIWDEVCLKFYFGGTMLFIYDNILKDTPFFKIQLLNEMNDRFLWQTMYRIVFYASERVMGFANLLATRRHKNVGQRDFGCNNAEVSSW